MRRREIIALIGGAALAWPGIVFAEVSARQPLVAVLTQRSPDILRRYVNAFAQGMQEFGLIEGRDYDVAIRSTDGDVTRVPKLLAELIALKPAVILTTDTTLALAAKRATKEIPIVGVLVAAPVEFGLVKSIAHPGGNFTGLLSSVDKLVPKQLELLQEVVPMATRIGVLFNASNPANSGGIPLLESETASKPLLKLVPVGVRAPADIDTAFQTFAHDRVEAVLVFQDTLFSNNAKHIADLALAAKLPTIFGFREQVEAGGLMSYGLNISHQYRRTAAFVEQILKGASPADLPVEMQPRLELVINLKTAKALGVTIPADVLAFANDVIE
jgi:putative ABC transport system substrate-binding protein